VKSILIIRLSAIGDVVHTLPSLEVLRRSFPKARIGWIVEELSAPLLEDHPAIDRLYVIPKRRWRGHWVRLWRSEVVPFFRQVRADGWEAAIDFQGLTKSGVVARVSGARVRVGYGDRDGREINKLFTNRKVVPPPEARHVVERNLALLAGLGVETPDAPPIGRIPLRENETAAARRFFEEWGVEPAHEVAILNPGAGWKTKRWPRAHFVTAAERLWNEAKLKPLVVWGPKEEALRDAIVEALQEKNIDARAAPATGLRDLAALVREAALFIGGDTGPTHLAAMQGVPTVGVFGGSDAKRNGPWGPQAMSIQLGTDTLPCIPCWKGECRLPREDPHVIPCLERLDPERVVQAALKLTVAG